MLLIFLGLPLEKILARRLEKKIQQQRCLLLLGAGSQSQIDVAELQRAENVAGWSVTIGRREELEDDRFVTIEGDGAINIRCLMVYKAKDSRVSQFL